MRVQHEEPQAAIIVGVGLAMASVCLLSSFLSQSIGKWRDWASDSDINMLMGLGTQPNFVITLFYLESFFFIVVSSVLGFGLANVQMTASRCKISDLVSLTVYLSNKVMYLFLVEKACIVNGRSKPRLYSKSWLLNMLAISAFYIFILIFEFLQYVSTLRTFLGFSVSADDPLTKPRPSRYTTVEAGVCIVNGKLEALVGIILWDIGAKVYLSSLFLKPLWNSFFLKRSAPSPVARRTTVRFLIGLACLVTAAIVNASVLAMIHGEPMWIIMYSSAVIHWMTLTDQIEAGQPPLVMSNEENAVDNSHPSARSRRNTMSATSPPPEWLRPSSLQAPASGQSLIGMLSEDDDKELRFAHHRSLLEIERRFSKGVHLGAGRVVVGGRPAYTSAAEEGIDSDQAQAMVAERNIMSGSSDTGSRAVDCCDHQIDKGKRAEVAAVVNTSS
ncbi:hypothetical protein DHEL01_v211770 [Diaporthe helianthi]|uniref:Uncharacterized protein n=1 Tax=Diaporthe helianthi TaxID=158607 RepID=A0A2P5HHW4_DIAHE|nr:hypothetical protein DHEL01_v211770 [Diaporthe helianthi]